MTFFAGNQVDDLLGEVKQQIEKKERTLVTTLTKRMSEDLTDYYANLGLKVRYLHSDIDTLERMEILRDLRLGTFDVLIGINLLREGLDLPEVSLVAILDADKEGFLRSERSLILTCGRTARNVSGRVIMYADTITLSMKKAISETKRRRRLQGKFNREHGITPETIKKSVHNVLGSIFEADYYTVSIAGEDGRDYVAPGDIPKRVKQLQKEMRAAAKELEFERAAELRDEIIRLEALELQYR